MRLLFMKSLFQKEEEIMYAIWDIGHPCVISEILEKYPKLKRNTVAKVLNVLVDKGYLKVDSIVKTSTRTGRAYVPLIKKEVYQEQKKLMEEIVESDNVQEGILSYCSTLIDSESPSEEFICELEKMIEQYKNRED